MNFIRRHRRPFMVTALIALFLAVAVLTPHGLRAQTGPISGTLANWLSGLLYFFLQMAANLLVVIINIMVAIAQYNNFLGSPAVEKGWVIVRDLSNMFFIVVLLIIAFGTILKLENYRYNRLLARLIVMAVLVNFSKFIAGFFIDFAQVIMLTFVNAWRDAAAGNITYALGLQDIVALADTGPLNLNTASVDAGAVLTAVALGLILVVIAVIVMAIIAIVLLLRIIALWFLVVLSPLAYLLRTYPSTEKYAGRWWQEFGKYVVVGPVVGFLLWLTLAIMSQPSQFSSDVFLKVKPKTSETAGLAQRPSGESGPSANITATITKIGQSERLLSYMMGIMLLVGTLVITKELGVAGGQLAGQWADKIKGFATKAATVGGATMAFGVPGLAAVTLAKPAAKVGKVAAGAVAGNVLDRLRARTGIELRPNEWIAGIKRAQQDRREEADVKMRQKALSYLSPQKKKIAKGALNWRKRRFGIIPTVEPAEREEIIQPRPLLAARGLPRYAYDNFWNMQTARKVLTPGGLAEISGKKFHGETLELERMREEQSADERRVELIRQSKKDPADVYVERKLNEIVEGDEDKGIEGERKRRAKLIALRTLEAEKDIDTQGAASRYWKREENVLEEQPDGTFKTGKKVVTFEEALRARNISPLDTEAVKKFKEDWSQQFASEEVNKTLPLSIDQFASDERAKLMRVPVDQRRAEGRKMLGEEVTRVQQQRAAIESGKLSTEQIAKRQEELNGIEKELKKIDEDIKAKQDAKLDASEIIKLRKSLETKFNELKSYKDAGKASKPEDIAAGKHQAGLLKDREEILQKQISGEITDSDIRAAEEASKKKAEEVLEKQMEVAKYRPAVAYDERRQLRDAINEKKKRLQSDSWQEHLAVFDDAVRKHDTTLAAAAFQRAAEYGNENEIMSAYGVSSGARGLKDMMEKIFMKQLGMSEDQALAIATDISYTSEKNRHWGISRATAVDQATGRQVWQTPEEQNTEVFAEVRKADFEDFVRRTNRLGMGEEVVGLSEFGPDYDDTEEMREKRAKFFRAGGGREFKMAPFAGAFIGENFGKLPRNITQSRFNVNAASKLATRSNEANLKLIRNKLRGIIQVGEKGTRWTIDDVIDQLEAYGSKVQEQAGEFELVKKLVKEMRAT